LAAVRDITEQKRAEEELRQSRAEIVQNHRRLLALSQSAQAVQRAKSRDEVYRIIGDEVNKLGFQVIVLRTTAQPSCLAVSYWTFESALLHVVEKVVGQSTQEVHIWLDPDEALQRVMSQGESVFFEDTAQRIGRGLPSLGRAIVKRVVAILEIDRCIYAPIEIGGNATGILVVAGRDLDENDVPAVAILANQAGIAIENLELLEEQRASQARMQNLARQVVSAQEEERQRLSRVLHDESGQALTALKISLELIAQDLPAQQELVSKRILDAATLTDSTMERIRQMAQDLRPPALDTVGLLATLEGLCEEFAGRTKISVDLQAEELTGLPEPVSITLFRIVQEALTNVARHAKASQVRVALRQDDGAIRLQVEDNGTGSLPEALPTPTARRAGMGLEGIRERLESLGGRLELASQPGHGSRLTAIIPVREASAAGLDADERD
jgi:signal transduction histidine kinase